MTPHRQTPSRRHATSIEQTLTTLTDSDQFHSTLHVPLLQRSSTCNLDSRFTKCKLIICARRRNLCSPRCHPFQSDGPAPSTHLTSDSLPLPRTCHLYIPLRTLNSSIQLEITIINDADADDSGGQSDHPGPNPPLTYLEHEPINLNAARSLPRETIHGLGERQRRATRFFRLGTTSTVCT